MSRCHDETAVLDTQAYRKRDAAAMMCRFKKAIVTANSAGQWDYSLFEKLLRQEKGH
jgi:hypothetical protein